MPPAGEGVIREDCPPNMIVKIVFFLSFTGLVGIISVLRQLLDKLIRTLENAVQFCKDIYQHIKHLWLTKNKI